MPNLPFDATITLAGRHLDAAGVDPRQCTKAVVAAVRSAVQRMEGANWIDVMAADFPPTCPGWITVYPRGSSARPDTQPWRDLHRQVENMIKAALVGMAAPF